MTQNVTPPLKSSVAATREDRGERLTIVREVAATAPAPQRQEGADTAPLWPRSPPLSDHSPFHLWSRRKALIQEAPLVGEVDQEVIESTANMVRIPEDQHVAFRRNPL